MHIIPVIDLRGGLAVAACRGARSHYQPLSTQLCPDGSAVNLMAAYRRLYGFRTIYIADLDRIEGTGDNQPSIQRLAADWPEGEIWCDHGMKADAVPGPDPVRSPTRSQRKSAQTRIVLGSESQNDWRMVRDLAMTRPMDFILSLDYRGPAFLGPERLEKDPSCWPDRVIVMMLDRVGTAGGPGLNRLAHIVEQARGRQVYAAGGIRNRDDLKILESLGVFGALIATALHHDGLSPPDLAPPDP